MPRLRPLNSYQFREQLPMFATAREIQRDYLPLIGDLHTGETQEGLWTRKYYEATRSAKEPRLDFIPGPARTSLKDSILDEGVKNPVSLQPKHLYGAGGPKPMIVGGHHRIAVMAKHRPDDLMPVNIDESASAARRSLGDKY